MKHIIILFLLSAMLGSCATQPPGIDNRLSIQLKDSTISDYTLLVVRDSEVLVSSASEPYRQTSPVHVIPFSEIAHIYRYGVRTDGNAFWGVFLGGLLGGVIGSLDQGRTSIIGITLPMGILIGASLLGTSGITDKTYDLSSAMDRSILKQFAQYPYVEPPELQKIK